MIYTNFYFYVVGSTCMEGKIYQLSGVLWLRLVQFCQINVLLVLHVLVSRVNVCLVFDCESINLFFFWQYVHYRDSLFSTNVSELLCRSRKLVVWSTMHNSWMSFEQGLGSTVSSPSRVRGRALAASVANLAILSLDLESFWGFLATKFVPSY